MGINSSWCTWCDLSLNDFSVKSGFQNRIPSSYFAFQVDLQQSCSIQQSHSKLHSPQRGAKYKISSNQFFEGSFYIKKICPERCLLATFCKKMKFWQNFFSWPEKKKCFSSLCLLTGLREKKLRTLVGGGMDNQKYLKKFKIGIVRRKADFHRHAARIGLGRQYKRSADTEKLSKRNFAFSTQRNFVCNYIVLRRR